MPDWKIIVSVPAAFVAAVTLWGWMGFPTIATSGDISKLNRSQADIAVDLYDTKLRRYLAVQPPSDPVTRQNWEEEVRRSRAQLDAAEKRKIELSK